MDRNRISQNLPASPSNQPAPFQQCGVRVSEAMDDPDWDHFVSQVPGGSHVQTSLWAHVKAELGYKPLRIIVSDSEKIVGGGQLLVRSAAPGLKLGFMPKGPIYCAPSGLSHEQFFRELYEVGRDHHLQFLAVQPPVQDQSIADRMSSLGFRPSLLELASVATILIDLLPDPADILAQMKRQTRQNIRRGERERIACREGTENDLATFYSLHRSTSERQGFKPYPDQYYRKMWEVLEPYGYIQLIIAEYNGQAVSALLLVPFNDTVVAKILGWSGQYPELRPNDAVFWAAILWAKSHGFRYFDLEGIDRGCAENALKGLPLEAKAKDSYTFFKLGYGGQIVVYPQAYDFVYNPVLRWAYSRIFAAPGRWSDAYLSFDRIRRRLRL